MFLGFPTPKAVFAGAVLVPGVLGLLATGAFFAQGGFGGGHGKLDGLIASCGLPATWLLEHFPGWVPAAMEEADLRLAIRYPALLNLLILWLPPAAAAGLAFRLRERGRPVV